MLTIHTCKLRLLLWTLVSKGTETRLRMSVLILSFILSFDKIEFKQANIWKWGQLFVNGSALMSFIYGVRTVPIERATHSLQETRVATHLWTLCCSQCSVVPSCSSVAPHMWARLAGCRGWHWLLQSAGMMAVVLL